MKFPGTILFLVLSLALQAQVPFQAGVGIGTDDLSGVPSITLGQEATVEIRNDTNAHLFWYVAAVKPLGEKTNVRAGLELMKSSTNLYLYNPETNVLVGNNLNAYTKIGLPIDFQYQPVKFITVTVGGSVNNYFSPSGNFIGLDPFTSGWSVDEMEDILHAIDIFRTYSFDLRYGIALMPIKNLSVECIRTQTLNKMNDSMIYANEKKGLELRLSALQFRVGYSFAF